FHGTQKSRNCVPGRKGIVQANGRLEPFHHWLFITHDSLLRDSFQTGSKQAISLIRPTRSVDQRTLTFMPVFIADSLPASTACSMGVSAPSTLTSAQANGFCKGCLARGSFTQHHVVTTPVSAKSTNSSRSSAVTGSYSWG